MTASLKHGKSTAKCYQNHFINSLKRTRKKVVNGFQKDLKEPLFRIRTHFLIGRLIFKIVPTPFFK